MTYEAVTVKNLLAFNQAAFKSADVAQHMAKDFVTDGGHPFDVLKGLVQRRRGARFQIRRRGLTCGPFMAHVASLHKNSL